MHNSFCYNNNTVYQSTADANTKADEIIKIC